MRFKKSSPSQRATHANPDCHSTLRARGMAQIEGRSRRGDWGWAMLGSDGAEVDDQYSITRGVDLHGVGASASGTNAETLGSFSAGRLAPCSMPMCRRPCETMLVPECARLRTCNRNRSCLCSGSPSWALCPRRSQWDSVSQPQLIVAYSLFGELRLTICTHEEEC